MRAKFGTLFGSVPPSAMEQDGGHSRVYDEAQAERAFGKLLELLARA